MRILLFIRANKGVVFHDLAKIIKEKLPNAVFAAHIVYHQTNRRLLEKQTDFEYVQFYSTDDMFRQYKKNKLDYSYISYFEQTYSRPNGWMHVYADRDLLTHTHYYYGYLGYNHEEILRWVQAMGRHLEHMFNDFKPDIYLDFAPTAAIRSIPRPICRRLGIKYVIPMSARYKNFFFCCQDGENRWPILESQYYGYLEDPNFEPKRGYELLNEFRSQEVMPEYAIRNRTYLETELNSFISKKWLKKKTLFYIRKERARVKAQSISYRENHAAYRTLITDLIRDWRKIRLDIHSPFIKGCPLDLPYCFFPLSVIPEANTAVYAPFFMNELFVVESLAKSLPLHFKLYVKEHLPMLYKRPLSFYRHLQRIPNVVLVDPSMNSADLIQHSTCVASISGTAGLEAVLYGKPSLVLGRPWYSFLNLTKNETDITKFPTFFANLKQFKPVDRDIAILLQSIEECGFEFDTQTIWNKKFREKNPELYYQQLSILADAIIEVFNKDENRD